MKGLLINIIFIFLLLDSCTFPVGDLPQSEDKLIVQCEFTNGQDIALWIFKGVGIPSEGALPQVPDSLEIMMTVDDEILDVQKREGSVPYFQVRVAAMANQKYTLEASVPNSEIKKIFAKTYIPFPPFINNFKFYSPAISVPEDSSYSVLAVDFNIKDDNEEKYYELIIKRDREAKIEKSGDTTWFVLEEEEFITVPRDYQLREGIDYIRNRNSFIIDFYKLNRGLVPISLLLPSQNGMDIASLKFTLRSITNDGYKYIKTYDDTGSYYYSEFPILDSNIENGAGIFTAYAQTEYRYIIDKL